MVLSGIMVCTGFFLMASDKVLVVLAGLGLITAAAYKDGAFMQFDYPENKKRKRKERVFHGTDDSYKSQWSFPDSGRAHGRFSHGSKRT